MFESWKELPRAKQRLERAITKEGYMEQSVSLAEA